MVRCFGFAARGRHTYGIFCCNPHLLQAQQQQSFIGKKAHLEADGAQQGGEMLEVCRMEVPCTSISLLLQPSPPAH